jgi:hypothetical protein
VRFPLVSCSVCLLVLSMTVTTLHASTSPKHGCAPAIPPPVSSTLSQPSAIRGLLFINEVLLTPHSRWNCSETGKYTQTADAWVELYNSQEQAFDLYAVHAGLDSGFSTNTFYFSTGTAIAPHSFLVVFPRENPSFLMTETSTIRLLINGTPVDEVTVPTLGADQSYARIPDGGTTWQICSTPTIDSSNTVSPTGPQNKGNSGAINTGVQTANSGVQPTWTALYFPTATTSTPTVSITPSTSNLNDTSSAQPSTDTDLPRKIILTMLAVAFVIALFWCWRLFTSP